MIDLHTHILPGVDDGSKRLIDSVRMLKMEKAQGVELVALTPHFYRYRERPEHFLERRDHAWRRLERHLQSLPAEEREGLPQMLLGCEVAWVPNLIELDCLPQLCIGQSRHMLLELPFTPWDRSLSRQICELMEKTGITPIIAHLERYLKGQSAAQIREILSLGVPVQISADGFLHFWTRRKSLDAIENWAHVIASDCHDMSKRPPCLGPAMEVVEKKLGKRAVYDIERCAKDILGSSKGQ